MGYNTPEDIANRALQHCGVPPSNRISSLTESSKNAKECALAYHKLRKAELRRNVWRFTIRHAVLRPIATTTETYSPPTYAAATTYALGDIVSYTDTVDSTTAWWISTIASNTGNTPTTSTYWQNYFGPDAVTSYDSTVSYYAGELVYDSTPNVWISLVSANTNTLTEGSNWHMLSGTGNSFQFLYPIGAGPTEDTATRNVFRLPYGFLREAPQDPKRGAVSYLGAPSNLPYDDWLIEGNYIVSSQTDPIIYRFVADWSDVTTMDAMFCEGFAARLAYEICEPITQSTEKLKAITTIYSEVMGDARDVNAIEVGAEQPPADDYLAVRY